ncbi:hypothetical protein Tco_0467516 [Tanacetum coccineum]
MALSYRQLRITETRVCHTIITLLLRLSGQMLDQLLEITKCKAAPYMKAHNHCPIVEAFGTNMGSAIRNNKSEAASYMEADIVDPYTPIVCRKVIYQHNANAKKGKDHVP